MNVLKKLRSNLEFNIVSAVVILLLVFSIIVSTIGYISFTNAFIREYTKTTYHMALTASTLVDGNKIDDYLNGKDSIPGYEQTVKYLDLYCNRMNVTLVYVIKVDTSDYGSFKSIFNSVQKGSKYTPWETGYERKTTNDEYAKTYRDIYEKKIEYGTIYRTKDLNGSLPHITTLVPIKNDNGDVTSILCIQRPMQELKDGRKPYLINIAVSTVILAILVSIITATYIRRQFVKPIRKVINEAHRFAKENKSSEKLGSISRIEDIKDLASSIDKMEEDMLQYIDNLTRITGEKERISAELSVATTIQENSLPNIFPPFPNRSEFDIYASMKPAKEVGGDFYDFLLIDDDHIALSIADVSDKGIPAALFMMVTKILISERAYVDKSPAAILNYVNNRICTHNKANMFVTVWLGILEISTGKLIAANAGHENPVIYRKNGKFEMLKDKHGLVIGALENVKYTDYEIVLNKGDKLFVYTDGLVEASDINNNMFGIDKMIDSLNKYKDNSPKSILNGMQEEVNNFIGDAKQFDDLTMLCFELKDEVNKLTIDAKKENLPKVNDFVNKYLDESNCSFKTRTEIELCVEEIFVNISSYAYEDLNGKCDVIVNNNKNEIKITFIDSGIKFDPLEKEKPDISLSVEERKIGGLGIYLVKEKMDNVEYKYENNKNILTITKIISEE